MVKKKGAKKYNLIEVISLMIITALATATFTYSFSSFAGKNKKNAIYQAELSEFIDTYDAINTEYYTDINKKELVEAGIKGMLDYVNDPYTTFMIKDEADDFNEELEGEFVGLGVEIQRINNEIEVLRVLKDSPAEKIGLKTKDIIVKVNDKLTKDLSINDISKEIKGKKETKVKIVIKRNNEEQEIVFTRDTIIIESVKYEVIEKKNKKIGYVIISTFAKNTYEQFEKAIKELQKEKVESLIIDLRGNTGGYLDVANKFIDAFLDKGKIMYQLEVKGKKEKIYSKNDKKIKLNTVILVNGGTASASELFSAGLNENNSVPLVGTNTFGKGKVQKTKTLSSGALIKYTIQSWLTPNGNLIEGIGLKPTYEVALTKKYIDNPIKENDAQLQKAIDVITKNS